MGIFKKTAVEIKRKEFFKNLDGIYKDSKDLLKKCDTKLIPIDLLKKVITAHKYDVIDINKQLKDIKATSNETKAANEMPLLFNNTLDSLITTCRKQAKAMNSKSLPLHLLKNSLDYIKYSFDSAL